MHLTFNYVMVLELYFYGGCGFTFRGVMTLGHLGWGGDFLQYGTSWQLEFEISQ